MTVREVSELEELLPEPSAAPSAYAECVRIARALAAHGRTAAGFLPADSGAEPLFAALPIARALADRTGAPSAYVDAAGRLWEHEGWAADTAREPRAAVRWLREGVAAVAPASALGARDRALAARAAIEDAAREFPHVLVDLSGFDERGELGSIAESVREVIVLAAAGRTREATLARAVSRIPPSKRAGVLLLE